MAHSYINEMLKPHAIPHVAAIGDILMHDNAWPHRAPLVDIILET